MKLTLTAGIIAFVISLSGCKKDNTDEAEKPVSPVTGTRMEFTLDSIYLYAGQVYLWNDVLPSYASFNPRKYTALADENTAYQKELFDITQLKNNPATSIPYENPLTDETPKYSYLSIEPGNGITAAVSGSNQPAVLKTAVINSGDKKIAYIALGSFPLLSSCQTALDQAFATLAAAAPRQLVIDLRSNGGGYIETAEYVANLIAGTPLTGKVMFTEQYNSTLQNGKGTLLKHQPYLDDNGKQVIYKGRNATMADIDFTEAGNTYRFSKKGPVETVSDIYFLVSSRTASASELLISCLKPYFYTKLIGEKTYGKPVGFFAIHVDIYSIYLSSFLLRNAQGWSDYFNGIQPDIAVSSAADPVLGDPEEAGLSAALAAINGTPQHNSASAGIKQGSLMQLNEKRNKVSVPDILPTPMIENRLKLK